MLDNTGRKINYLRISVTDRCDLRCRYCMPEEGVAWQPHGNMLSYEQILRLCRIFASLGVEKVRLTGGEPLVRRGLSSLVAGLKEIPGIRTVALTTNGVQLQEQLPGLLEAGLDQVNISLDTLDRQQYAAITRRDRLEDTLAGLHAALDAPGLTVKLNAVLLGENDSQLPGLAALAKDNDLRVRFIELMPIGLGRELPRRSEAEAMAILEEAFGLAKPGSLPAGGGPAHYMTFDGFRGQVGFISAMSHKFCTGCDRVRLTSGGFLKTCLQFDTGVELKKLMDAGAGDEQLLEAIRGAIAEKPLGHHFTSARTDGDESKNMNQIGG